MEGGMPGPSHGNTELNQEQQGEYFIAISYFRSPSTITNSNNLAVYITNKECELLNDSKIVRNV